MSVCNLRLRALLQRRFPLWMLTVSLPSLLRLAVVVLLVASCTSTSFYGDFFVPVTIDERALLSSTVRRETLTGITPQRCVSLAVIRQWPILVCHLLDSAQMCTMWDWQALNAVRMSKDRTLIGANCKMTDRFIACNSSVRGLVQSAVPMNEFQCDSSSYKFTCTEKEGIVMEKVRPRSPLSRCSAPFAPTPVGCLYINNTAVKFSEARMTCLDYGTELVSPDSLPDLQALQTYLKSITSGTTNYWCGLVRQNWAGDDWMWLGNGRRSGPDLSSELKSHTNESEEWYARMVPDSYGLFDGKCNVPFGFVCEAKGV